MEIADIYEIFEDKLLEIVRCSLDLEAKLKKLGLNVDYDKVRSIRMTAFDIMKEIVELLKKIDLTIEVDHQRKT